MQIDSRGKAVPPDVARANPEDRNARLSVSLSGTNLARAGDYNQRVVLQAIRVAEEVTRSALAVTTGLTAPTIANITRRLLDAGLIVEAGRQQGARGQPAVRLRINPDGCFAIGLNIDRDHITLVMLDLVGRVRARATLDVAFAMPDAVVAWVATQVAELRAAGVIDERRLLGVGIAVPDDLGRVALPNRPDGYEIWNDLDVRDLLGEVLPWPMHIDNDAAAAAIGEAQFGSGLSLPSFFYILVSAGLGGALVIDGNYFRGAGARSGEIGFLPDPTGAEGASVQDTVSLSALFARLDAAGRPAATVATLLGDDPVVAAEVDRWIEDAARALAEPLVAIACLVDPGAVLIGGRLPSPLVEALVARLAVSLKARRLPAPATVTRAAMADDAPAVGAAILPFLHEILPSDSILMQARRIT